MKIFVSHSASDKLLVNALERLIRGAFARAIDVIYSSASVSSGGPTAGQDWIEWIYTQIESSIVTIVVLTPLSKTRPWLMWEAGAVCGVGIARGQSAHVVPLLYGLQSDDVPSPLRSRQTKFGVVEKDIHDLLESIVKVSGIKLRSVVQVEGAIKEYLAEMSRIRIPEMYDVFVSCPMSSVSGAEYDNLYRTVDSFCRVVEESGSVTYCAMRKAATSSDLEPEYIAAETDFSALKASRNFVMVYPQSVMSSCIVEAGYALISGMPSTYFVRNDEDLPYMLRGAVEAFSNVSRVRYRAEGDIVDFFTRFPGRILR
jgi:hypothetical protein